LGAGLQEALDVLNERKKFYKQNGIPYYQPWLILMTDGKPTDNYFAAAESAKKLVAERKLNFLGVGIGDGFDYSTLRSILPAKYPPLKLKESDFKEFFKWLSASMKAVSASQGGNTLTLPPVNTWAEPVL
jgi:uncharacterized protein YegL